MKSKEEIKHLFLVFQTCYLRKWRDNFTTDAGIEIAIEQWREALDGIDNAVIEKAAKFCRDNIEWPPSIAEFIRICEKEAGVPSMEVAFEAAIRRDFNVPLAKLIFDKVGSWAMSHDEATVLSKKFKAAYDEVVQHFRATRPALKLIEKEASNE